MSLEQLSYLAQIVGSAGIIISFVFVGLQIRQNTAALQRNEHNSTMREWTVIRMGIAGNRDLAELMTAGLRGESVLDPADQLRLEMFLNEQTWAAFHIWDRTQRGVFPKGTFEFSTGKYLADIFRTPRGETWWRSAKTTAFPPPFVADVDAVVAGVASPIPSMNAD
ncbi:MAG: hypothetical protein ACJ8M1_09595 [Chthoniobacterales bacterium]